MRTLSESYQDREDDPNQASFAEFPFELDHFQKHSVNAINNDRNVLVTAFTGSGKTLVAEYAIKRSLTLGKKVIYTSPIKSLSNQKFAEFRRKFPTVSVGIFTGDIKFNPFADVTIMTTEILRNMLYRDGKSLDPVRDCQIDIHTEVEWVVFDEIHYINDEDRGKVWEECLIMLPKHIKLVLLSATIDKSEDFATWLHHVRERPIDLIPTFRRYVPLKYSYYFHGASEKGDMLLDTVAHRLVPLLDESGQFQVRHYEQMMAVKRDYENVVGRKGYVKKKNIFTISF